MDDNSTNLFFEHPVINSPYEYPSQHWELDASGQPTQKIMNSRRVASFITPIPKPKKQHGKGAPKEEQLNLKFTDLDTQDQQYDPNTMINTVRHYVDAWRKLPQSAWKVTAETARLLEYWRHHEFNSIRPFFCQVEAVEVVIWLTEVAPQLGKEGKSILDHLVRASHDANPEIMRLALKLATGAGKTTVMAMIIAWQTINAVRRPTSRKFTRGFLITTPGITIKDRLRVLKPNDPDSYYKSRELVPEDMLPDLLKAKIVITNYHAYRLREKTELSKRGRALLQGRTGEAISTIETEGQMLQRVMPELMGMKNILAINDEAHHCYREKPSDDESKLKGEDKAEAEANNEAARIWISGLEIVNRHLGLMNVIDLSATPFFLRGSGYPEGSMFPWCLSDFSLMDAIECGIVKLPRVPVADNIPNAEMPMYRNLWENITMPKKARGKDWLDPEKLDPKLQTAMQALYGHYEKTFELWEKQGIKVPPCFIIICNNTASSKLVYDYISGYEQPNEDGTTTFHEGRLPLFQNYDANGNRLGTPHTLLIDSVQLESGEKFDDKFFKLEEEALERFRNELKERGDFENAEKMPNEAILREVMNTVGKEGRLGAGIRCVVSVSMLTEGWDANTVTHVLGVRAFGTQLLCEQVIGRALRRQSYELNEEGLFDVEYADVFGIPFDFTAKPVVAPPKPPPNITRVKAISPERDALTIRFPRVKGYRVDLKDDVVNVTFSSDSKLVLSQDLSGATKTENQGIIGKSAEMNLKHTDRDSRHSTIVYNLVDMLIRQHWKDKGEEPPLYLFGTLKKIVRQWIAECLTCVDGTYEAQLLIPQIAQMACEKITNAIVVNQVESDPSAVKAIVDPYNPEGSTRSVNFNTSKTTLWETSPQKCHVNYAVLDSSWEGEFCRIVESHPQVVSYVKNHSLGFEIPYMIAGECRIYRPDFIVRIDDGHGPDDLLNLIVEIKGFKGIDVHFKNDTTCTYWVPGVNRLKQYGRWAFAIFDNVLEMEADFAKKVEENVNKMIAKAVAEQAEGEK